MFSGFEARGECTMKILIIDDNDTQHELFRCYAMTDQSIELLHAVSLEEAVELLSKEKPEIVFLDNRLQPYSSFSETVPHIKAAGYEGKIVVISSETRDPVFSEMDEYGVHSSMDKSAFNIEEFSSMLQKIAA